MREFALAGRVFSELFVSILMWRTAVGYAMIGLLSKVPVEGLPRGGTRLGMRTTRTVPPVALGRTARRLSQEATSSSKADDAALATWFRSSYVPISCPSSWPMNEIGRRMFHDRTKLSAAVFQRQCYELW